MAQPTGSAPLSASNSNADCSSPTVSVIIAAFSMKRWKDLREAVESVGAQTVPALETIVVIDHNPDLLDRASRELVGATVIPNGGNPGASAARNTGVAASGGELIAFIDDDAIASSGWLETLLRHFTDANVVGVGGRLDPLWARSRPSWFPPEFDWAVGASYLGMPINAERVRNVWSNNMAIRRRAFDEVGGFRSNFGKVGARSRPEDTDLCLRAGGSDCGGIWIYDPAAAARHKVPADRTTARYFVYRCFNEGWGKAALAALNGMSESTATERRYTRHVLPAGITRGVSEFIHGDASGGQRSLTIVAGLTIALIGFLACRIVLLARVIKSPSPRSATVADDKGFIA